MAGYSGKPLSTKLGIKPGCRIALVDAPPVAKSLMEPLPTEVEFVDLAGGDIDIVLVFTTASEHLAGQFTAAIKHIKPTGMIWIAWPKKAAKANTDLDENKVRDIGLAAGVVDVKVCAIDEYWSGLKFVIRVKDR
jgi:hypothetical protein